ncbi:uncharacterized protein M6G45_002154 [Spheniscus humboldti]
MQGCILLADFWSTNQTCPLTNAAEHDKRSSPGTQELNVLGTEAVDSHLVRPSLEGDVGRARVHSVRERSCHRDDGRLVVRTDHQRKTSLVVWSVQLMLVDKIAKLEEQDPANTLHTKLCRHHWFLALVFRWEFVPPGSLCSVLKVAGRADALQVWEQTPWVSMPAGKSSHPLA